MKINKFRASRGLVLFRFKSILIEIWWTPKGAMIDSHYHENVDSLIIHIWGHCFFNKVIDGINKTQEISNFSFFRWFSIPSGIIHSVLVGNRGLLFLNIEKWKLQLAGQSLVDDLVIK